MKSEICGAGRPRYVTIPFSMSWLRSISWLMRDLSITSLNRATAGTFHSVAARLLRAHAELLGYRGNFSILDSEDSKDLLESATSDLGIPFTERRFPKGDVLHAIVSFCINTGRKLDDVIA